MILNTLSINLRYAGTIEEKKSVVDEVSSETYLEVVHDLATNLLKVGKGLQTDEGDIDLVRYQEHLPGKNLLLALSVSNLFFSVKEFHEFYGESYHMELASEQSWPLQPLVRF